MAVATASLFSSIPKAQASQAASVSENLDYARQVVAEVTPVVFSTPIDNESASLALAPDGYLAKPLVAETKITPERILARVVPSSLASVKTNKPKVKLSTDGGNHFAYGYCTYYVASRRNIPWFGNAGTWLSGAQAVGFATGDVPQVGAIIVTSESRWGHVGIVESVNSDGTITISEMNYSGWARVSSRTISTSYGAIKGYIY